jgi:SNF2 family DNA or RNA helicase
LIKPFVIRRTKGQVLTELPAKRRASIIMQFDEKQRQAYWDALQAAKNSSKAAEALRLIEAAKQAAVKGKLAAAIDWIENFIETEKLVVFCTHNLTVDALMAKFGTQAVKLTGAESLKEREVSVDRFQNDDSVKLFVGNLKAAGVGITLTAASNVAFLELGWTPGDHSQAEDRCHRIGQTDSVTAWYLLADNTIEEKIFELIEMKRTWVETVHDGKVNEDLTFSMMQELTTYIKGETK